MTVGEPRPNRFETVAEQEGNEQPHLMPSMLLYIDALGTREAMSEEPEVVEARFQAFRTAWSAALGPSGLDDSAWLATAQFSDLIVGAEPIDRRFTRRGEQELHSVISSAASFQFFLALEGIFVRGAIVRGLMWMSGDTTYGPALGQAYELESRSALYPRVVLSPELRDWVQTEEFSTFYGGPGEVAIKNDLLFDSTGTAFLNYLEASRVTPDEQQRKESIRQHAEAIHARLFDTRGDARAHEKILWAGRYHNYYVASNFPEEDDLKVKQQPAAYQFATLDERLRDDPGDDPLLFL